jgi:hypothetical protein
MMEGDGGGLPAVAWGFPNMTRWGVGSALYRLDERNGDRGGRSGGVVGEDVVAEVGLVVDEGVGGGGGEGNTRETAGAAAVSAVESEGERSE